MSEHEKPKSKNSQKKPSSGKKQEINSGFEKNELTSPPAQLSPQDINADIQKLQASLIQKFAKVEKIQWARSLSPWDISLAAVNAFCPDTNYQFPLNPRAIAATPSDTITVTFVDNPTFFYHICSDIHQQNPALAQQVIKQGVVDVGRSLCSEYLELLQQCSRAIVASPENYREDVAQLTAAINYSLLQTGKPIFGVIHPMIGIKQGAGKMIIHSPIFKVSREIALRAGDTVYFPGAGYNALSMLETMKKRPGIRFILNDNNRFITRVLELTSSYCSLKNIGVFNGSCQNLSATQNSISCMIVSLLHHAGRENLTDLAENASQFMKREGWVFIATPTRALEPGGIDAAAMINIFQSRKFKLLDHKKISYELMGSSKPIPDILNHSPEQLIAGVTNRTMKKEHLLGSWLVFRKE